MIGFFTKIIGGVSQGALIKVLLGLTAALAIGIGFYWFELDRTQTKYATEKSQKDALAAKLETKEEELKTLRLEIKRVEVIDVKNEEVKKEIVVEQEIIYREVIEYRDSPDRVSVILPSRWVCIHDAAATMYTFDLAGKVSPEERAVGNYRCETYQPADDIAALTVINENYAKYYELQADYNSLWQICSGYTPQIEEVGRAKK